MAVCPNCSTQTRNPKFCSSRCAAIFNNSRRPPKNKPCKRCGKAIEKTVPWKRRKLCNGCRQPFTIASATTIGEIRRAAKYQVSAVIRQDARRIYFTANSKECKQCGYTAHIQVCHKKAIRLFNDDALLTTVNHLDNLIGLCPNHHWELDHGLLNIPR